jgi:hypothetical protein
MHLLDAPTAEGSCGGPNWAAFLAGAAHDPPKHAVAETARALRAAGYRAVLITGRQADQRQMTMSWLIRHSIPFDELHMRPVGDPRADTEVKFEVYERLKSQGYEFLLALEDRDSVTKMWREQAGITCLQVCPGAY